MIRPIPIAASAHGSSWPIGKCRCGLKVITRSVRIVSAPSCGSQLIQPLPCVLKVVTRTNSEKDPSGSLSLAIHWPRLCGCSVLRASATTLLIGASQPVAPESR